MVNTLVIANQKGGVGKTTTSINLAVSFAVSEVKTLLIDLDPQANASTGLSELLNPVEKNVYDVIISGKANESIASTSIKDLHVIKSTNELVGAEVELVFRPWAEFLSGADNLQKRCCSKNPWGVRSGGMLHHRNHKVRPLRQYRQGMELP